MTHLFRSEVAVQASDYVERDLKDIHFVINHLKSRNAHEDYADRPAHHSKARTTQPYQAPDFSVAFNDAMPDFGYDAATSYAVGGTGEHTLLWATFSASEQHNNKVRKLAVLAFYNPLRDIVSSASYGTLCVRRQPNGQLSSNRYTEPNDVIEQVLPKAFLLSHLVRVIRDFHFYEQDIELYEALRNEGHTPLGFEQMAGLANLIARDTLDLNPDLRS